MSADLPKPSPARNPYVFVVGCPRSGTTLLQRMLDHHPQLTVANDTHFIPRVVKDQEDVPNLRLTPDLVERVIAYKRFRRLGLDEQTARAAAENAATYQEFVSALYDAFGRKMAKPLAGETTPDYVRNLPLLAELFPWAKFIHIVRDGRDVALSAREWAHEDKGPGRIALWKEEPMAVCALWWRGNVSHGLKDGATLGPERYCEIRYEALVAHAEERLRELAAFLSLPDAPEMAGYHVGKTKLQPGRSAKTQWLPPTTGLRDWRAGMNERDLALFEALAGDLLITLGYERGVDRVPPEVTKVAEHCRAWWKERRWHRLSGSRESAV